MPVWRQTPLQAACQWACRTAGGGRLGYRYWWRMLDDRMSTAQAHMAAKD